MCECCNSLGLCTVQTVDMNFASLQTTYASVGITYSQSYPRWSLRSFPPIASTHPIIFLPHPTILPKRGTLTPSKARDNPPQILHQPIVWTTPFTSNSFLLYQPEHYSYVAAVIRSTLSNWMIEFPLITIVPIFSDDPPSPAFSAVASSSTTFRNASYPRSVPVTLRLLLSESFSLLSCCVFGNRSWGEMFDLARGWEIFDMHVLWSNHKKVCGWSAQCPTSTYPRERNVFAVVLSFVLWWKKSWCIAPIVWCAICPTTRLTQQQQQQQQISWTSSRSSKTAATKHTPKWYHNRWVFEGNWIVTATDRCPDTPSPSTQPYRSTPAKHRHRHTTIRHHTQAGQTHHKSL